MNLAKFSTTESSSCASLAKHTHMLTLIVPALFLHKSRQLGQGRCLSLVCEASNNNNKGGGKGTTKSSAQVSIFSFLLFIFYLLF